MQTQFHVSALWQEKRKDFELVFGFAPDGSVQRKADGGGSAVVVEELLDHCEGIVVDGFGECGFVSLAGDVGVDAVV